jgi:hypothetical protein
VEAILLLASSVLTAFLACTPTQSASSPPETLAVHVDLAFDQSITSNAIKAAVKAEAAEIWRDYGVDIVFADRTATAALSLDVIVERAPRYTGHYGVQILGHTSINQATTEQAPIRISLDAVESLVRRRHGIDPVLGHDLVLAWALGRVLAHELGHKVLGAPAYHDDNGLMRTTFLADDLARPERSRFRLADRSVVRLRARMASFEAHARDGCPKLSQ